MDRPDGATLAITFLYYRDLATATRFYEDVLGLPVVIDQGVCKIHRLAGGAHVGLVDEAHGMNRWTPAKPVQLCLRVPDVDAWHRYAQAHAVAKLSAVFENDRIGIRAFVFDDPEGYQIEFQSAMRRGA